MPDSLGFTRLGMPHDVDWLASPLGPVSHWPSELVRAVRLVMPSRMPMMIWWGPQLLQIYNTAYARLLGDKHPHAAGRPAELFWSEVWDDLGTVAERVMEHGESSYSDRRLLLVDRHGYLEETYWTTSFSPLRADSSGEVLGILVASTDVTGMVVGSRRLETVRQLGSLSSATTGSLEATCKAVTGILGANRQAVPFATMHILEPDGEHARLAAGYGVGLGASLNPAEHFALVDAPELSSAVNSRSPLLITGLRGGGNARLMEPGPLGEILPDAAMLLPVCVRDADTPVAVATLGVNPYREVDDSYLAFFQLVARQLRVAISDAQTLEHERHRAEWLAELDEDKTRFYENISHELRTPITLVLGPLQSVLSDADGLSVAHRQNLLAAQRAGLRLRKLVDNMFQFSRAQIDELNAWVEPTDLAALTTELASMFQSVAEQADLELVVHVEALDEHVDVDREMWSQIVLNLLSNAIKFTSEGSIAVRLYPVGQRVVLEVQDTGIGIPSSQLHQIFERFSQVRGRAGRSGEGAGIGLALVRAFTQLLGGEVAVTSELGKGSTFRVEIPIHASPEMVGQDATLRADHWRQQAYLSEAQSWNGADALPAPSPEPTTTAAAGRLLLVEDNADMRGYLVRLLTDEGWTVDAVGSVDAALRMPEPPDLVVSDVMLAGASGLDLVRAIRADEALRRIPVILLTARQGPDSAAEGLAAGADDYITKPFDPTELLARIRVHHELSQLREMMLSEAEDRAANLRKALETNRHIGVAMGVLMARQAITEAQAFDMLRQASQRQNRKLREIADEVVFTGELAPSG